MSSLAHGVHYGVLVIGLLGLVALLGPQWVGGPRNLAPRDEHEARVADLQSRIAAGALGTTTTVPRPATTYAVQDRASVLVPMVVAGSAAAAGVHAALGPAHFHELPLFGAFFVASALAQIVWSAAMVLRPSRPLLVTGVAVNGAILLLWLVTRTLGLPFGLMPSPEAVGLWDLCCGAWEAAVVVGCVKLLALGTAPRVQPYDEWPSP
ncbi:MAG: hypothetical protein EOO67_14695, partial [Microbacterium sp.]